MFAERHVRLFRNGRNQAVRIPVNSSWTRKTPSCEEDGRLVIEPVRKQGLLATLAALAPLAEDWPDDLDAGLQALDDIKL